MENVKLPKELGQRTLSELAHGERAWAHLFSMWVDKDANMWINSVGSAWVCRSRTEERLLVEWDEDRRGFIVCVDAECSYFRNHKEPTDFDFPVVEIYFPREGEL